MPKQKTIKIGNKLVGEGQPIFVVAEAGVNHNGKLDLALALVEEAAKAGADAVKFQTFRAEQLATKNAEMAKYQQKNLQSKKSQFEMLKSLELKDEFYSPIIKKCQDKKIIFLSSAHGNFESIDLLQEMGVVAFKFGSGDLTNLPVLAYAAQFKKPIILGTGMATLYEVKQAIAAIKKAGNNQIITLHCTTNYPCPLDEVNLRAMQTMMEKLDCLVGYSDHTLSIETSVLASLLGAVMIEKHFTLDKKMAGPDHACSANPSELKEIIKRIRNIKTILGSSEKKPTKSEIIMKKTIRKSLVALQDIKKGKPFTPANLDIKRPGTGLSPNLYQTLLNKKVKRNIPADSLIQRKDYA